ncbi:MAG: hypothetical protein ACI4O7_05120 [Aristaeellaceae bacterium]
MAYPCPVVNPGGDLSACRERWTFNEAHSCWCLEDVLYTQHARAPLFQRLSVFVPAAYMSGPGTVAPQARVGRYTPATAPVVFENNAAGYMQMPHAWPGGPRWYGDDFLRHGLIYVSCGCRGRESRDAAGQPAGKAPWTLVDIKTALRFLRHNRASLPGDWERVICMGWSAGGAMSALLAVTGDHPDYVPYLRENGAWMEESDGVWAAQIWCPIVDLEHADMAYEWCFRADAECEDSPAGPAEVMTPFKEALSRALSACYVRYVNALGLKHPETGEPLTLTEDGRGGSFHDLLMAQLEAAATRHLRRLTSCTPAQYLAGAYTEEKPAPRAPGGPAALHHAGEDVAPPPEDRERPAGLGGMLLRPVSAAPAPAAPERTITVQGTDKRQWLSWDGEQAHITDLDSYVLHHRRRMKPCTSFDKLPCDSGENQLFGNAAQDYVHFSRETGAAIASLRERFPEAASWAESWQGMPEETDRAVQLLNPLRYIGPEVPARQARHCRIRVGASDADTSLSVGMTLAVALANAGRCGVDYALVWDQPHCRADYPGELLAWIDQISTNNETEA